MENDLSQRFWASYTGVSEKRRYRPLIAALCKTLAKSAGIGLSITAVCKNAGTKTLGQDDFFVVISVSLSLPCTFVVYLHCWNFLEGGLG